MVTTEALRTKYHFDAEGGPSSDDLEKASRELHDIQERWKQDGRWFRYVKFLEDGGRTLTRAQLVVKARKA